MLRKQQNLKIAASLLAADPLNLGAEATAVAAAGADWLHIDVMDGHFVPSLAYGPQVVGALKKTIPRLIDVHLMVAPVESFIPLFAEAGADVMTIHPEATYHSHRALQQIRAYGCLAGVALNPGSPLENIRPLLREIDLILIMTVNPGFGGQAFIYDMLTKVREARHLIDESPHAILLQVDGGINQATAKLAIKEGADILVAGTSIFSATNYSEAILQLRPKAAA